MPAATIAPTLKHSTLFEMATNGIDFDLVNTDYLARITRVYKEQLEEARERNISRKKTVTALLMIKVRGLEVFNAVKAFGPDHGIRSIDDAKCLRVMLCSATGICCNVIHEYIHGYQGTKAQEPHFVAERQCGMRDEHYKPLQEWK